MGTKTVPNAPQEGVENSVIDGHMQRAKTAEFRAIRGIQAVCPRVSSVPMKLHDHGHTQR